MTYYLRVFALSLLIGFINPIMLLSKTKKGLQNKFNFNTQWLLKVGEVPNGAEITLNDNSWKKITLPRAFNEDEAFKVPIDSLSTSIVWYRKHFKLPKGTLGKKIFLEFEGIRFAGEFYVNGKSVGIHENGVMAVGLDISDFVKNGDNVIAVRIDNSWNYKERATGSNYQWNDKNFNANYGGIPKNVYLHIKEKVYQTLPLYSNLGTTGTYVYAKQINITKKSAIIHAESQVRNENKSAVNARYEIKIQDGNNKVVKTFSGKNTTIKAGETITLSAEEEVNDLNFWSWGYGYLYNVTTTLFVDNKAVDVVETRTGFRKTRFADGMVWLNDRVIQMKGYAQRTSNEWPAVGMSVPSWLSDYSNKLMVDSNANLVRWMHVTPWKQDVESCDRVGLIQAMPAGDSEKDVEGRRWELRVNLMRDAIIYNRNNPSILFYESGNESISEDHMKEMKAIRDKYDPYGGRAIGSREMLDSKIAEYGGEMLYINKSAHIPMWATEYCRDEALRKYWDDYSYPFHKNGEGSKGYRSTITNTTEKKPDAQAYNQNQDSFAREDVTRWFDYFRVRPGTGDRVSSGGVNIIFSDSNTHFRGEENYRRSGEVDPMRIPKDAFFAHQVIWDGWVDIEKYRTHIVGHWNYTPDVVKEVTVIANGEQTELFINGRSQGFGTRSSGFIFTFPNIRWEEGVITAVSYDENKKELSRSEIKTAGKPASLRLTEMHSPDGFKADGADLALVQIEVVDENGNRCPLANDLITFDLEGPAEWRGGIAQGKDNFILSKILPVECGVNRVLIRSTDKSGIVKLTAQAKGLSAAEIKLITVKADNKDISNYITGKHQPLNLSRGATPKGPSYKVSRNSIKILGADAESNPKKVGLSYDDNELTEWTNNGTTKTGWITYELERDAEISEIELKLSGWRMRSYPIQIFIDGKLIYTGETQKSLGYISIPITPTRGRFVKIQLNGQSVDKDGFGEIIEITGQKELDLYKDPKAANVGGQLRIVEVEFYEKAK